MIKKRTRPQARIREHTPDSEEVTEPLDEEEAKLPLADLLEFRRMKRLRQGIDASKLSKGDSKKRKIRTEEEEEVKPGLSRPAHDGEDESAEDKARKAIRTSNFTQQTNALDVDKHMMQYIEQNLTIRSGPQDPKKKKAANPEDDLFGIGERWNVKKQGPTADDGTMTNSMRMLTAIPEVDLGMDARLKNIEDTEKAKRVVAGGASAIDRPKINKDEEHLVATRFYRPNLKPKSDADIIRDAKLEAMGLQPQDEDSRKSHQHHDRVQLATDEAVMERFKKRMKK